MWIVYRTPDYSTASETDYTMGKGVREVEILVTRISSSSSRQEEGLAIRRRAAAELQVRSRALETWSYCFVVSIYSLSSIVSEIRRREAPWRVTVFRNGFYMVRISAGWD